MPVVKGGVWTNIEDEILKASVSKYGMNQWARVSSLLVRKTPKQCKARWTEWLDPGIRKIEWSKEEDEKLLHLAKLMPTQWRTIAPIVGRTATQCLERYQKLLDDAEARESDEFGLGGPSGGETAAPSADDVRRLRPGELDPDPESKPAKPDTIDLDEDEKEMLSEARARLANTQGKKAKRKARERQLEESRRLASLQKRRELKSAGINIKVVTRKPGQMDYNADIPFEKAPAPGFYDTQEEEIRNQRQREAFDPRKQQLANKRKSDMQDDGDERKKRKDNKNTPSAASAAAAKAGQMQKIREAERSSKRRALVLPSPQVDEAELEALVKMEIDGQNASRGNGFGGDDARIGLVGNYSSVLASTPIRTPKAPQEEDRIANEIRNARARTETQSALLGGENPDLYESERTTGYQGAVPTKQQLATPNPLAVAYREAAMNGLGATPVGPGATPMRTPRDTFRLNDQTPNQMQLAGQTPREIRLRENAVKDGLRQKLAALPKPKAAEWEFEIPEDQQEMPVDGEITEEDASIRDEREKQARLAAELAEFRRQTQVVQRSLPRPKVAGLDAMLENAANLGDPVQQALAAEVALLVMHDAKRFDGVKIDRALEPLEQFTDEELDRARMEIALELGGRQNSTAELYEEEWDQLQGSTLLPGLGGYGEDMVDENQLLSDAFNKIQKDIEDIAAACSGTEKHLSKLFGGYQARSKSLRQKMVDVADALEKAQTELETKRMVLVGEEATIVARLERLRENIEAVMRRERQAQELYRERRDELAALGQVNGH